MVSEVVRGKALASVVESALVTDASGNRVELRNLQPDGTIGEPAEDSPETGEAPGDVAGELPSELPGELPRELPGDQPGEADDAAPDTDPR
jgi:trigger factor